MNRIFDFLFSQYAEYSTLDISLEITAVIFGLLSVVFSKKNNILVFPTGMISTLIFVYLLRKWGLLGDMLINAYYFIMSVYGWYIWTRKDKEQHETPISKTTLKEKKHSFFLFIGTILFVIGVYLYFDKFNNIEINFEWLTIGTAIPYLSIKTVPNWTAYIDIITTAIFFVGMWLMAKRKIENWIYWIIGDIISVPLYFYKGYTFTSFQYVIFTFIAIFGYLEWKKYLYNTNQTL